MGERLGEMGFNIVSGLAKGCDTAAHKGCLRVKGFITGIVAHGLDTIYPNENRRLADEIVDAGGALISEYFIGSPIRSKNFQERDRLQAGLSVATIVIQTGMTGGTWHTVDATIRNNKILAAVKYRDDSEKILGNKILIEQKGAYPITSENLDEFFRSISGQ